MKSQAWGWLTAGVLALGLNGFYHDGGAQWAHRAVNQVIGQVAYKSEAVMALAAGRADLFAAKSDMLAARGGEVPCRLKTLVARLENKIAPSETKMAQFELMTARQEAALARMEANRARFEIRLAQLRAEPLALEMVHCPGARVNISR
jgi:septal ring factor EnvC (AmiA/AmiB activator)